MDLALDTDNDLDLDDEGDVYFVEDIDAIAQDLRVRLRWFLGEWFLDRRTGLPFYERIAIKHASLVTLRSVLRRAILSTPGVLGLDVLTVEIDGATRAATVTFEARTTASTEPLVFTAFVIEPEAA